MQGLGLLAVDHLLGLIGGTRLRPVDGTSFLGLSAAGDACSGLAGRAQRDAVEPVAQEVRVADRPGLLGQHQEDGLEGILGMHGGRPGAGGRRPAPSARGGPPARRRRPCWLVSAGREPLEQLAVGEPGGRAALEEGRAAGYSDVDATCPMLDRSHDIEAVRGAREAFAIGPPALRPCPDTMQRTTRAQAPKLGVVSSLCACAARLALIVSQVALKSRGSDRKRTEGENLASLESPISDSPPLSADGRYFKCSSNQAIASFWACPRASL